MTSALSSGCETTFVRIGFAHRSARLCEFSACLAQPAKSPTPLRSRSGKKGFRLADIRLTASTSALDAWQMPVGESTHKMHSVDRAVPIGRVTSSSIPQGFEIDPELRTTVRFIQGSILDPRLLEGSPPYDMIFCRNLLIYLVPSARAALLRRINDMLAPDGVLLIGHADRLDSTEVGREFAATGDLGCFAYRRITCPESHADQTLRSLESPTPDVSTASTCHDPCH